MSKIDTITISLEVYSTVTRMGSSPTFLTTKVPTFAKENLLKGLAYCTEHDPDGQPFTILEADGTAMPEDVQRLYGKLYLKALNALRRAIELQLAELAATEVF